MLRLVHKICMEHVKFLIEFRLVAHLYPKHIVFLNPTKPREYDEGPDRHILLLKSEVVLFIFVIYERHMWFSDISKTSNNLLEQRFLI